MLKAISGGLRLVVAGSTLEGEEAALVEAWPQLLAADPQLADGSGAASSGAVQRRRGAAGAIRGSRGTGGRIGRLRRRLRSLPARSCCSTRSANWRSVYSLASVAFVGGSLVPAGGHNPLEPAQFGVPIVMGPHYANFAAITDSLRAHDALRIAAKEESGGNADRSAARSLGGRSHGRAGKGSVRSAGGRDGSVR